MTSITWSNDVDPIKTTISVFPKSMAITTVANLDISVFINIGRSLEILNLCMVLKNDEPVHVKHGKCIFVPLGEYSRMSTTNFKHLLVQKGSRVVQMIIAHKSFHIIYIFKR